MRGRDGGHGIRTGDIARRHRLTRARITQIMSLLTLPEEGKSIVLAGNERKTIGGRWRSSDDLPKARGAAARVSLCHEDAMTDYFRGDQAAGITAPDLSKNVGFSDHIVKARGKRTQFTSVSKDAAKIKDFGEMAYRLKQPELLADQHTLLEHEALMTALRTEANESDKAVRLKAVQAQRYAKKRLEGLVSWKFDTSGVPPNGLITWAASRVQAYFQKA